MASTGGKYGSRNGIRAHAGNIATDVAASRPYGARATIGSGGVSSRYRAASRADGVLGQLRAERLDPLGQFPLGPRRVDDTERRRDAGGVGHISVTTALVEWMGPVELMSEQEAVDFCDVHPLQQVRVGGVIGPAVGGDTAHPLVDAAHPVHRALRVGGGAESGHGQKGAGALQSAPGVAPIVGVLGDAGHRQRMQGLQEKRPQSADEHRRIGVHPPNRAILVEPARARRVVDARAVRGTVRARNQAEQAAAQVLPHGVEIRQHRHGSTVR